MQRVFGGFIVFSLCNARPLLFAACTLTQHARHHPHVLVQLGGMTYLRPPFLFHLRSFLTSFLLAALVGALGLWDGVGGASMNFTSYQPITLHLHHTEVQAQV